MHIEYPNYNHHLCPCCGRCPHCGYVPQPWGWPIKYLEPYWVDQPQKPCGGNVTVGDNAQWVNKHGNTC